ncbi:MAG: NUDIX hydrolase [Candidatus Dormibacteraceae bacterium]
MPHSHPNPIIPPDDHFLRRLEGSLRAAEEWGRYRQGARHAAVNTILCLRGPEWHIPFVLRRPDLRSHPGQVGLPGGGVEPGETAIAAALRETEEEIGVTADRLRVLGATGSLYAAVTNYNVATFVTALSDPPEQFSWDRRELVGVVEVPLSTLLDADAWCARGPLEGPQLETRGIVVWGLTAAILRDGVLPRIRDAVTREPAP